MAGRDHDTSAGLDPSTALGVHNDRVHIRINPLDLGLSQDFYSGGHAGHRVLFATATEWVTRL